MVPPCGLWQLAQPPPLEPGFSVALKTPCEIACEGIETIAMATITAAAVICSMRVRSDSRDRAVVTNSIASFTEFPCLHSLLQMHRVWHKELPMGASLIDDNSLILLDLVHTDHP